jgi:hypothetical protein
MPMAIKWKLAAASVLLAAGSTLALAQGPGPGGYGPGMMGGNGQGQGAWSGRAGRQYSAARLDALRQMLKITTAQQPAWNRYVKAVTDAHQQAWSGMQSVMRPGSMMSITPDQRFAYMQDMLDLRKKTFESEKSAAEALLPHLSEYQQGQASMVLPGLAQAGYGLGYGRHRFGGWGMMGGFGGGYGPGMTGFGPGRP